MFKIKILSREETEKVVRMAAVIPVALEEADKREIGTTVEI